MCETIEAIAIQRAIVKRSHFCPALLFGVWPLAPKQQQQHQKRSMGRSILLVIIVGFIEATRTANGSSFPSQRLTTECGLDVAVECSTPEGLPCDLIELSDGQCNRSRPKTLSFIYSGKDCSASAHQQAQSANCVDLQPFPINQTVTILCRSKANRRPVAVEPANVRPGDGFRVVGIFDNVLPLSMQCLVRDQQRNAIQENTIDISPATPLNLMDRFGALTVTSCGGESCQKSLDYRVVISNEESSSASIQSLVFALNSNTFDLKSVLASPQIAAGTKVVVPGSAVVDICSDARYFDALALVRYDLSNNGSVCQSSGK